MFRTLTCPSSGGKIVFTQHLVYSRLQRVTIPDSVRKQFVHPEDGHVNARNMSRIVV